MFVRMFYVVRVRACVCSARPRVEVMFVLPPVHHHRAVPANRQCARRRRQHRLSNTETAPQSIVAMTTLTSEEKGR